MPSVNRAKKEKLKVKIHPIKVNSAKIAAKFDNVSQIYSSNTKSAKQIIIKANNKKSTASDFDLKIMELKERSYRANNKISVSKSCKKGGIVIAAPTFSFPLKSVESKTKKESASELIDLLLVGEETKPILMKPEKIKQSQNRFNELDSAAKPNFILQPATFTYSSPPTVSSTISLPAMKHT
jgi:hypothetical protein